MKEDKQIMQVLLESATFDIPYGSGGGETKIEEVLNFLERAKSDGATHVKWSASVSDYSIEDVQITPYFERPETDEEYNNRITEERTVRLARKRKDDEKDKAEYERLKKKFEK